MGPRRGDRGRPRAGRLAGRGAVAVDGTTYTAEHVVVATGSDAAFPPVPGLRELPCLWTDREVTALTEVPLRLLVLGGGPMGVEMAQAVRLLGASVTVVQRNDHLLPREPAALGEAVAEARRCAATRLLVATGRRPRVEDIGLETVGITPDPRGIAVDGRTAPARTCGPSGTSPACGCSPTSASTRGGSWRRTSAGDRARPTTRRCRG